MSSGMVKKQRLYELDRGKGLAIILVVMGHIVARTEPLGAGWYMMLRFTIYLFHMPFFVFLSGVAMSYTYRNVDSIGDYFDYTKNKFNRFIPIFFIFGVITVIAKTLAEKYLSVDNTSTNLAVGLRDLVFFPGVSSATTLWYIYVLFMYYLIFPIFEKIKNKWLILGVLTSSIVLSFFSYAVTHLFLLERFSTYLCFVVLGWIVGKNYEAFLKFIKQWGLVCLGLFVVTIYLIDVLFYKCIVTHDCTYFPNLFNIPIINKPQPLETVHVIAFCGFLSIPALIYLLKFSFLSNSILLERVGKYVFIIYLLNTLVLGALRGVGLKFVNWDNQNFFFYFPILLISGIFIPIVLKKYVVKRFPKLDRALT